MTATFFQQHEEQALKTYKNISNSREYKSQSGQNEYTLNESESKSQEQFDFVKAHSSPPDYITRNIVISSDGVFCALIDKTKQELLDSIKFSTTR